MQSLLTATRSSHLVPGTRAFSSSVSRWLAVPQQKPVLMKEFKIYRWVGYLGIFRVCKQLTIYTQNPDQPEKKPELQSYKIDLNQTGPMVCILDV